MGRIRNFIARQAKKWIAKAVGPQRAWKWFAQPGELDFHKKNRWRQTEDFTRSNEKLLLHFGFRRDEFKGKIVIDLGAGSRLRTLFFEDAHLIVVEPLAGAFYREIPWCDLGKAAEIYPVAAEEFIPEIKGLADAVLSINALDHGFDFQTAARNVFDYLKPGGLAFLSFDLHEHADEMHPLEFTRKQCEAVIVKAGFVVLDVLEGTDNPQKPYYGHGQAISFRLRKPE